MSARAWLWLAAGALVFPWIVPSTVVGASNVGAAYALVAASLVLLTGWVGQISLGHAALVGIGAFATGWASGSIGLPFPLSLPVAAVVSAGAAALLGVVALRVRGLFLAVATLIFSWMASEFLFRQDWVTRYDVIPGRVIGGEGTIPSFDFSERTTFYYVAWALVAAAVALTSNVRDSKTGRAFFAVRGSEMAAASLGIDVTRYKLVAFAVSGGLAGAAGNLIMSDSRTVTADQFTFTASLFFVAVAVVGGLQSLGGAVGAGLLFAGLSEVFFRIPALGGYLELVSALLLAVVLLAYRGGLAAAAQALAVSARSGTLHDWGVRVWRPQGEPARLRASVAALLESTAARADTSRRLSALRSRLATAIRRVGNVRRPRDLRVEPPLQLLRFEPNGSSPSPNGHGPASAPPPATLSEFVADAGEARPTGPRDDRRVLVEAEGVTVRFGGLTAVQDASLQVREGEIVGLIGPNGAGKTTLFNSIAGFNTPQAGTIRMFGTDVTHLSVHLRARMGVARTFQAIQLFGQLTVFDNLLVATHVHNPTGIASHAFVSTDAMREEREARERVDHVLNLLGLGDVAGSHPPDLSFGTLRMVEVARALVTGFRVIMLDEPASGLDNAETDKLMEILGALRSLGVTMLLIEHDVRMVTGVSDYMYVLDQGRIIADGLPRDIHRDPAVVTAYLGGTAMEGVSS